MFLDHLYKCRTIIQDDEMAELQEDDKDLIKQGSKVLSEYISFSFINGDLCEETQKPREAEVRLFCCASEYWTLAYDMILLI